MSKIIEIKNVSKHFNDKGQIVRALDQASFNLEDKESMCIIGPSGSGKSTLLHLLGGLDNPSEGEIIIDGKNLKDLSDVDLSSFRNKTIGFIFQFFHLQEFLTAEENIMLPLLINGADISRAREKAEELLNTVGLTERAHHTPKKLSGGEQQRIAIARALANNPKLILADEPTGNLDEKNANMIIDLLRNISESGVSVVVITHDLSVKNYFHKSLTLQKGKIN